MFIPFTVVFVMIIFHKKSLTAASKEKNKMVHYVVYCRRELQKPLDWLNNPCHLNVNASTVVDITPQSTRWQDIENETKRLLIWMDVEGQVDVSLFSKVFI